MAAQPIACVCSLCQFINDRWSRSRPALTWDFRVTASRPESKATWKMFLLNSELQRFILRTWSEFSLSLLYARVTQNSLFEKEEKTKFKFERALWCFDFYILRLAGRREHKSALRHIVLIQWCRRAGRPVHMSTEHLFLPSHFILKGCRSGNYDPRWARSDYVPPPSWSSSPHML